jgi:hypothetical protein
MIKNRIERNGTEQNGTELNITELYSVFGDNGTEQNHIYYFVFSAD